MNLHEAIAIIGKMRATLSMKCIAAETRAESEARVWAGHSDFECSRNPDLLAICTPDIEAIWTDNGIYTEGWLHGVLKFVDENRRLRESKSSGHHQFRSTEIMPPHNLGASWGLAADDENNDSDPAEDGPTVVNDTDIAPLLSSTTTINPPGEHP